LSACSITDSFGRPWRWACAAPASAGRVGAAARLRAGLPDRFGNPLRVTQIAVADAIAAAAALAMG
jgi:coenzyme F420-0:L-glutamate ligase/coenzyme F420-1:gamma-L-glutamate ligase